MFFKYSHVFRFVSALLTATLATALPALALGSAATDGTVDSSFRTTSNQESGAGGTHASGAAVTIVRSSLTDEEARAIAVQFAPRFRFHRNELFLPVDPLFVLSDEPESWPQGPAAASVLGTADERTRRYLSLSWKEKQARAQVYYHVQRSDLQGPGRLVVQYWLYYIESRYRTKKGFFPFSMDFSHPNDFEHLCLLLAPVRASTSVDGKGLPRYSIERIITNVHSGLIPDHFTPLNPPLHDKNSPLIMVELGSHTPVPDVDEDGVVRTQVDIEPGRITWGLRDTGRIWAWRSPSDSEPRTSESSITLVAAASSENQSFPSDDGHEDLHYQLMPASQLDTAFRKLELSSHEEKAAFRGQTGIFKRLFGKNDGGSASLRLPSASPYFTDPGRFQKNSSERQRGLSIGYTNFLDSYSPMIGGRIGIFTPRRPWPKWTAGLNLILPADNLVAEAELLASYEIDMSVDAFGGAAFLATKNGRGQIDWLMGLQLQLDRFRLRGAFHRSGEINNDLFEFRIQYDLWR